MKNILITGSNGQLGSEIREISDRYENYNFIFTDINELDLTIYEEIISFFDSNKIDVCINCAAYTAVDNAEDEVELAMLINFKAVENLSKVCSSNNTLLFHISTDYVFNGKHYMPYSETDNVSPDSQYGLSKLKGEEAVMLNCDKAIIVRTSWLYSSHGNNFVKTIIKLGDKRDQLNVVSDQVGTPTYAADLAEALMSMVVGFDETKPKEIYHFSNEGAISWYDFAKAIIRLSGIDCTINPIHSNEYPSKANRPFYSVLSKSKIKTHYDVNVPYWEDSLHRMIIKSK